MIQKLLQKLIRRLLIFYYRKYGFLVMSFGVDEHLDIIVYSAEYYNSHSRFGTRVTKYSEETELEYE